MRPRTVALAVLLALAAAAAALLPDPAEAQRFAGLRFRVEHEQLVVGVRVVAVCDQETGALLYFGAGVLANGCKDRRGR